MNFFSHDELKLVFCAKFPWFSFDLETLVELYKLPKKSDHSCVTYILKKSDGIFFQFWKGKKKQQSLIMFDDATDYLGGREISNEYLMLVSACPINHLVAKRRWVNSITSLIYYHSQWAQKSSKISAMDMPIRSMSSLSKTNFRKKI